MVYPQTPEGHSEFGGGPGLIDPALRKARILSSDEERMEIVATDPADAGSEPTTADIYYGLEED